MSEAATEPGNSSRDIFGGGQRTQLTPHCGWCGRRLGSTTAVGRRRRYCGQSCRQRAYERRAVVQRTGLPEDAVILSGAEVAALQDRLFQLRCAAEDIVTAANDGADIGELGELAQLIAQDANGLERLR